MVTWVSWVKNQFHQFDLFAGQNVKQLSLSDIFWYFNFWNNKVNSCPIQKLFDYIKFWRKKLYFCCAVLQWAPKVQILWEDNKISKNLSLFFWNYHLTVRDFFKFCWPSQDIWTLLKKSEVTLSWTFVWIKPIHSKHFFFLIRLKPCPKQLL